MNDRVSGGALFAAGTALWPGVLTSISPCPPRFEHGCNLLYRERRRAAAPRAGCGGSLHVGPGGDLCAARVASGGESDHSRGALQRARRRHEPDTRAHFDTRRDVHAGNAPRQGAFVWLCQSACSAGRRTGASGAAALGALLPFRSVLFPRPCFSEAWSRCRCRAGVCWRCPPSMAGGRAFPFRPSPSYSGSERNQ